MAATPSRRARPKTHGRANIHQVAAAAGVSVATVSRALQNPGVVVAKTRDRVMRAVQKLGYTPNFQARTLRTARTQTIIALVPDIANPFFAEVIKGIEQLAHEKGYAVLLGDTQNDRKREQAYANLLAKRQADGLITLLPRIPRIDGVKSPAIVNACDYVTAPDISSVRVDNVAAAREATAHLLGLGHRKIAFVSGPMSSPISVDRERGYFEALNAAGLKRNAQLTAHGDFTIESGVSALEQLFARRQTFTAVFCSNDEMAIGAIRAAKARGLNIPRQLSVVGFDDIHIARYYDPPLTTIVQPKTELGREAMKLLLELLEDSSQAGHKRVLPARLIVRESSARPGN